MPKADLWLSYSIGPPVENSSFELLPCVDNDYFTIRHPSGKKVYYSKQLTHHIEDGTMACLINEDTALLIGTEVLQVEVVGNALEETEKCGMNRTCLYAGLVKYGKTI